MAEKYRRPHHHERVQSVGQMIREQQAERDALLIVRYFNERLKAKSTAGFWPTVGTALTAKHPWVAILCESCGGVTDLDLRMKPRDPDASIRVVLRDAQCPRCNGLGRSRIVGLASHPSI